MKTTKKSILLIAVVALIAVMCCSLFVACDNGDTDTKQPQVLIVGTTMAIDTLNRLDANGSETGGYKYYILASTISQLPIIAQVEGNVQDMGCSISISDEGKYVTLTMNDGYTWHDGEPVTIEDVRYTLDNESTLNEDYTAVDQIGNSLIYSINVVDSVFISKIVGKAIAPKHILENETKETITDEKSVIGAGPFKFVERDKDAGTIVFEKYDAYPKADSINIDKVIVKTYGSSEVLTQALTSGEIDMIYNYSSSIDANTADALKDNTAVTLVSYATKRIPKVMYFNNQKMTNANVKKAIAKSIDYDKIRSTFGGNTATASREGFVAPGIFGYKETAVWTRDLEGAKALLKQEGYSESNKFHFELLVRSSGDDTQYATLLKTQIEETGMVEVELIEKGTDWQSYYLAGNHMASLVTITPGGYDMVAGYGTKYTLAYNTSMAENNPVAHGQLLVKDEQGNLTEYGTILTAMASAKTSAELKKAVSDYQDYIVENTICVPFFYDATVQAVSSKLDGIKIDDIWGILSVETFETLVKNA